LLFPPTATLARVLAHSDFFIHRPASSARPGACAPDLTLPRLHRLIVSRPRVPVSQFRSNHRNRRRIPAASSRIERPAFPLVKNAYAACPPIHVRWLFVLESLARLVYNSLPALTQGRGRLSPALTHLASNIPATIVRISSGFIGPIEAMRFFIRAVEHPPGWDHGTHASKLRPWSSVQQPGPHASLIANLLCSALSSESCRDSSDKTPLQRGWRVSQQFDANAVEFLATLALR